MYAKLLKHNFKYVGRYFWIIALASLVFSAVGGFFVSPAVSNDSSVLAVLGAVPAFLLFIFSIFGLLFYQFIMCAVRYYKHFFSDEGYLTFTLPVKRSTQLNVKIVNWLIWSFFTTVVASASFVIFMMFLYTNISSNELYEFFNELYDTLHYSGILSRALIVLSETIFGVMLTYLAITIGAVVAKKHKVLAAIGVMMLINTVNSIAQSMFSTAFFTIGDSISDKITLLEGDIITILGCVLICVIYASATAIVYCVTLHLLERRLNLA